MHRRQSSSVPAYHDVVFSRVEVQVETRDPSEENGGIQLPHWIIPPKEPKRSRPSVLIAWIALRSVDRWKTDGIPPQLPSGLPRSLASLTQFINKTILPSIPNKIEYDLMNKLRTPGVSETSVRRALGFRL
jgi:hypothetical protein